MQVHGLKEGLILTYLQEETITQDGFTIRVMPGLEVAYQRVLNR